MGKSKRETEEAAKNNKVVTMPRTDCGENAEEVEKDQKKTKAKKALRRAAKEVVKKDCDKLADKLMEKANEGDLHSAELLLTLTEKKKKKKGGEGDDGLDGPSLAEQLMEGPTWEEVLEARRKAREEEEAEAAAS